MNTADLARRATTGDVDAYGALVELQWEALVRLARSVLGDRDAEDAVQDALVAGWRAIAKLKNPEAVASWLKRITLRRCFAVARRRPQVHDLAALPEPVTDTDPSGNIDVARILAQLAPKQRAVMHLTIIDGLSDSEIGAALGVRAGTVRAHRRRARLRLSTILAGRTGRASDDQATGLTGETA